MDSEPSLVHPVPYLDRRSSAQLSFQSARRCFLLLPALLKISLKVVKKLSSHVAGPCTRRAQVLHLPLSPSLLRPLDHKYGNFNASLGLTSSVVRPRLNVFEEFLPQLCR